MGGGTGPCTVSFQGPDGNIFGGATQHDLLLGNALMATVNKLYFDNTKAGFLRFNSLPGGEVCFGVGQVCAIVAGYDASVRLNPGHKLFTSPAIPNGADYQRQNFSGPVILATVPEPSSLTIMAGALMMLALFGFARARKVA